MIFRSPSPDVAIPSTSLTPFVLRHARRLAAKPALIDGSSGRCLTYGHLAETIDHVAAGLTRRGFGKGDVFATVCPNLLDFPILFYAVSLLGGTTTMANPLLTAAELGRQLVDSRPRFALTVAERLAVVREAAVGTGIEDIFVAGEADGATSFAALLADVGRRPTVAIDPAADVALLPYSSGTTGQQKGVMLTHRNLVAQVVSWHAHDRIAEDEVVVVTFPFFHLAGIMSLNTYLGRGNTLVLMRRFEFAAFLRLLQDHRATRTLVAPPVVLELGRHPLVDDHDLSRLRQITWGAAPLSDAVARACGDRLGCRVKQVYGLTEAAGQTHLVPTDADDRRGSAGPPVPGMACRIVDLATGAELGPGQTGEICVRGPQVMKGYLHAPAATAAAIDADGWLRTGDVGFADADGWIVVADRVKELIKYKGYQVAPAELEAVLLSHPAVADAAVVRSPDEEAGEVPKAFVVLAAEATAEELLAFVAARVAPYKKVRRVEFVEQIPKSPSGKILRRVLVERERAALLGLN
jgi:acyl-CoA synthetase (AMP-forming)/AMP-acid ligase II